MRLETVARTISLLLALAIFGVLGLVPFVFGPELTPRMHGAISLMLIGAAAATFHGFGFRADGRLGRILASAPLAWALIAAGGVLLALR